MSIRFLTLIISWLFPISIGGYLLRLTRVLAKIKREQTEYWVQIGSPSLSDPNGQVTIFRKIIFGVGLPTSIASACKNELVAVRILLFLGVALFIVIVAMMYGGAFE